jgi:hypothetical protein
MPRAGTGKYADLCQQVLEKSKGQAAVLIVVEGSESTELSLREEFSLAGKAIYVTRLPKVLRWIADEIEKNNLI